MLGYLDLIAAAAMASAYVVAVLRFDPEAVQPTPPWTKRLLQTDEAIYPWSYFDYVRAWLGAYTETQPLDGRPGHRVFVPNERAYGFLSCPKCLSFWCALPFSAAICAAAQTPIAAFFVVHVAAALGAWLITAALDYLNG